MGKPARDAVYASDIRRPAERLILLVLADHSASEHSPFLAWPGVPRIAECAGMSQRNAQRYLAKLARAGIIERYKIDRYRWGYAIKLPEVSPVVTPDVLEVSPVVTPTHPYGVSPVVTPDVLEVSPVVTPKGNSGVTDLHSGVTDLHSGVTDLHSGVTKSRSLIRNERIERIEREENEGTHAHTRVTPSPSLVMSGDQAYDTLLTYLEGEVSEHERRTWRQRVRAGWSSPDVLCLRGPASLVRLPRFTGCMRMAAKGVQMGAVIEFSVIGA